MLQPGTFAMPRRALRAGCFTFPNRTYRLYNATMGRDILQIAFLPLRPATVANGEQTGYRRRPGRVFPKRRRKCHGKIHISTGGCARVGQNCWPAQTNSEPQNTGDYLLVGGAYAGSGIRRPLTHAAEGRSPAVTAYPLLRRTHAAVYPPCCAAGHGGVLIAFSVPRTGGSQTPRCAPTLRWADRPIRETPL